jgi:hypothetical protein
MGVLFSKASWAEKMTGIKKKQWVGRSQLISQGDEKQGAGGSK